MADLISFETFIALCSLTLIEIVLGIDNIVFMAVVSARLPKEQRRLARNVGLGLAMFMRIALLVFISWLMKLTAPLVEIANYPISGRDLILLGGGGFLLAKSTVEIHKQVEGENEHEIQVRGVSFMGVIVQILLLDIIFSLDSVITAVGMVQNLPIMIAAIVIAVGVMMFASGTISHFIEKHPTLKMLALSFLLLVGVLLVAEGCGKHIERGYIYFAMAFSLGVEVLNIRARAKLTQQNS